MSLKLKLTALVVVVHSLLGCVHATEDNDVRCLKEIKASLEDPFGRLSSLWDFSNQTEGCVCQFEGVQCGRVDVSKVIKIDLSGMGLKGSFPRGLGYCQSLTCLDLSNNNLSGTIPSDVSKLIPFVFTLDLSSNNFSGAIPMTLANCTYLSEIKLDHNQLTGNIPEEFTSLRRLKEFSVANNLLSGKVPDFDSSSINAQSYANNLQLCGGPLEPCPFHKHNIEPFYSGFGIGYFASVTAVFLSLSVSWLQVRMIRMGIMLSWLQVKMIAKGVMFSWQLPFPSSTHHAQV